jgi:hypothetical protein
VPKVALRAGTSARADQPAGAHPAEERSAEINRINERFFREQTKPQIDLVGSYTTSGSGRRDDSAAINPNRGESSVPSNSSAVI